MVKVKVITAFRDRENELKLREAGETFSVPKERADKFVELGLAEIVPQPKKTEKAD